MNVTQRIAIERRIVRHLIRTAKAHGYALTRVWDGGEMVPATGERAALDAVFSVDESIVYFKHPDEPKGHCAVIILGNGVDCVPDSSIGARWDIVMEESAEYADKLCD